jgi:spore coat protein U-like protein
VGAFHHYARWRAMACALVALACAASSPAMAGKAAATAGVITLRKLSILNLSDLNFASNVAGSAAGTVTIDPDNDTRANTGGTIAAGGVPNAAKFYTFGGPLQNLQVTRGALPVLARVGGGANMNVTELTLNGPVLRFLNAAGLLDLRVGGTLVVGANQLPGAYTGTFQITVTYY